MSLTNLPTRPLLLSRLPGFLGSADGRALLDLIGALPGPRRLIALAGAPGSGKSSLAAALVAALPGAVLVPMDGFHLDDRVLEARGLRRRKGAVETFDAAGFAALTRRLLDPESEVFYPVFDRSREISLAGAGVVTPADRIVVIEGNYLLLDRAPWNGIAYDLTLSIEVARSELARRLDLRWRRLGKSDDQIRAHLQNDLANADLVAAGSRRADILLRPATRD